MAGVPLRVRGTILFVALLTLAVLSLGAAALALQGVLDARERLIDRLQPADVEARALLAALVDQETGIRGFALTRQASFLEPYRRGAADEQVAVARIRSNLSGDAGPRQQLDVVLGAATAWRAAVADPTLEPPPGVDPRSEAFLDAGKARFDALRRAHADFVARLAAARADARDDLDAKTRWLVGSLLALFAVLVASAVAATVALFRWVLRPVESIGTGARRVAGGDLDARIEPSGPPELAQLGADIEAMRQRIRDELAASEEARGELARSNADLEQFAYVASHDLQEPLRKVASFCQLLEQRYGGQLDERADQYIVFAVDGAKRMQALINDLLAFSRVGRTTERFERVELDEALEAALGNLSSVIEEAGATVTASELPAVDGDPALLMALFQNLVANAVKFRADERPPRVRVDAEADGEGWRLTVTDNGIGIAPHHADRVFAIFQRLHSRDEYAGTGIGLALCKRIVEFHGGRIWIDPDTDEGTRIVLTLPGHPETP